MISVSRPKVKNGRGEQRADEESSSAATTRPICRNRTAAPCAGARFCVTATGSPRVILPRNINNKSFRLLSRERQTGRRLGEERDTRALATLAQLLAVAPRFVFVMNAPLSSSESIIAARFCPRWACSAVGTCLRNCKETGSGSVWTVVHQSENISKRRSEPCARNEGREHGRAQRRLGSC